MKIRNTSLNVDEIPRRKALLDAAISVFSRLGYRKTSMSDIAHAAGFSRQGLYFYYENKDELFRATVQHSFASRFETVSEILDDTSLTVEMKLIGALDEWEGKYVGTLGEDAADLIGASAALTSSIMNQYNTLLEKRLALTLSAEPALVSAYKSGSISPTQVARTLLAVAQGLKSKVVDRKGFRREVEMSVKIVLLPIFRKRKGRGRTEIASAN